jgi:hypothetical protein
MAPRGIGFRVGIAAFTCVLLLVSPRGQSGTPQPDAAVEAMVSQVSTDRLVETTTALAGIPTRFSPTSGCATAGAAIYSFLSRLGIAVEYESFRYNSARVPVATAGRNVVASLPGTAVPERVLVLGAHYDSFSNNQFKVAPGADDNASGVAALLEIARILSRRRFALTIRFVAFDAEELGTFGSEHAAGLAKRRLETIAAMLNLDMIGYSAGGNRTLAIVHDRNSRPIARLFVQAASRYRAGVETVERMNVKWARSSDHASFWAAGYPALSIIENNPDNNPHYHHTSDTPDTLDFAFLTAVTRATLAAAATLAGGEQAPAEPPATFLHDRPRPECPRASR